MKKKNFIFIGIAYLFGFVCCDFLWAAESKKNVSQKLLPMERSNILTGETDQIKNTLQDEKVIVKKVKSGEHASALIDNSE
jgi:hypothetical protein